MVNDDLDWHDAAPDTTLAFRFIGRCCQAPVSPFAIDWQRGRHSLPRRNGIQFDAAPQDSQLADFVNVSTFKLSIHNSNPNPFDAIANPELLFGVRSGADRDSKFRIEPMRASLHAQKIAQVRVALLIEGTSQPDSGLDRSNYTRPGNLPVGCRSIVITRPWGFDINLHNADATDRMPDLLACSVPSGAGAHCPRMPNALESNCSIPENHSA